MEKGTENEPNTLCEAYDYHFRTGKTLSINNVPDGGREFEWK